MRPDRMYLRVDVDRIQVGPFALEKGSEVAQHLKLLNLRRSRAKTLTKRIHIVFCALAAARVYRSEGWLNLDDIKRLEGWPDDSSAAKLLVNEFEFGSGSEGIIEQRGRGTDAQLRLRMPSALIELGELPEAVRQLFSDERPVAPAEDLLPQPIVELDLALAVADALRSASPDLILQVRPAYQGGRSSLVFRGLALRALSSTLGKPNATSVLVKVPLGVNAGKLVVNADALDVERRLLATHAGWPGLPARVEPIRIDLGPCAEQLRARCGVDARSEDLVMDALVLPLGHPRTIEAEPRLLSSIIDETTGPVRRLTRRDIHNALTVAERLAQLLRMLHRERRAHRHLAVDAITVRYELGIFGNVLAPDLAASVQCAKGSDDLLYRDLFDLGRILVHVITGAALSRERQNFQPPEFQGRRLITRAVVGEGETVARLLFGVSRYLLEAAPGTDAEDQRDDPTVQLLDHFLDEVEHISMLHWAQARGVPERRISLTGTSSTAFPDSPPPREVWARSAADPVATRLVTISHLVDVSTLRRWCEHYVTNAEYLASITARRDVMSAVPPSPPTVKDCLELMRKGHGRSAADAMWRYLWNAGANEPAENLVRILRNYITHWVREDRYDISHSFGASTSGDHTASKGLRNELEALGRRSASRPDHQLFVDWLDELKQFRAGNPGQPARGAGASASERRRATGATAEREYERLESWVRAAALVQLENRSTPPEEKDIYALERTLHARSAPEVAFWHILLARAWASAAVHGIQPQTVDGDPAWDKATRALIVGAGVAASRKLPFEMAAALLAAATLTRTGLSIPELRAEFSSQGVDEESVRVQAAECALLAADAYQWLDTERHHWGALLEAVSLLRGSAFPERLIQAFQLLSLARNNRLLYREQHQMPRGSPESPAQFVRYPLRDDKQDEERRAAREQRLFEETARTWLDAPGRVRTSDDPGTVVAHGYFSQYAPGVRRLFPSSRLSSTLQIEIEPETGEPTKAVDRLFALVHAHYDQPVMDRILDFGCGPGDDARYLARRHQVWAVDSPLWFATSGAVAPSPDGRAPRFIELDPVDYARQVCSGTRPDGGPASFDVVLFRCSLCRVAQRGLLLEAAHQLLRPGGLVVATDWVQARVTDRITWSRLVGTGRFVDLETEPGYRQLCNQRFTDFVSWDWTAEPGARAPAMHRWFQRRLDEVRQVEDERSGRRRSPYERAFLLRIKRDLEAFLALSGPGGPLGWLFWAARKPPMAGAAG